MTTSGSSTRRGPGPAGGRGPAGGEHADVVVVGSGFGGSVAAYRLASAGLSVVVLERGRAYAPGTFPRSPAEMGKAFWDPDAGHYGMYDVWSFGGCDSVVSSGLGGGSLIYANVLLRKDEQWFVHEEGLPGGGYESWPVNRADLDPHYDAVEKMIGVAPYPVDDPAYSDTPKTRAMQDAAAELGLDWSLPPLAISFAASPGARPSLGLPLAEAEYPNLHGVPRRTCRLCGECNIGCNDGAKNSLDHTYLSAARHEGADLRPMHQVREIRRRHGGGYEVEYVRHHPADGPHVITCDRLVLAAGTYGTSYLLLRSRPWLPGLSGTLGSRFSGNGDLLTFLLRAKDRSRTRPINASYGPVITSAIRLADEVDGAGEDGRGAYIQDGGYPAFLDWLVEGADVGAEIRRAARFVADRMRAFVTQDNNLSAELAGLVGEGALSSTSLPLLGMGRDVPDGELRLRGGKLDVKWSREASERHFDRLRATMRRISDVLGAEHSGMPAWLGKRIITVHPLGGTPMGRHPGEGVCDAYGEVFDLPGLYIADGSALPGPVGPNPSLTIAALADRMCTRLLEKRPGAKGHDRKEGRVLMTFASAPAGMAAPVDTPSPVEDAERTSLSFTEEMRGRLSPGTSGPRLAGATGREDAEAFEFRLTITVDDVDRFLGEPAHLARAEGWVDAASCGGRRPVERGWFNLFAPGDEPDHREMRYRLWFSDDQGRPRTLAGVKDVRHGPATRLWLDTSTLHTRLLEGHVTEDEDDGARVVGAGTLHIQPMNLAETLKSFHTEGPRGVSALARFGRFFVGQLWDVYGPG
ncbi:GMC family oxidoreductase [Sphaerisporangium sp. TRM90804]|uniref:GMC family oxidoreductase n=1 Tax=Sphaerisporangium sp. TRM90804 TaxID=3031113 RepID=UPI00244985A6|nr:GMC family oxidoreductase [Sphaerisporangium sp. TRM90804]MDH2427148.1 GMC family oxidoreductase [Sphaerisporangium sp. TRM90804]